MFFLFIFSEADNIPFTSTTKKNIYSTKKHSVSMYTCSIKLFAQNKEISYLCVDCQNPMYFDFVVAEIKTSCIYFQNIFKNRKS